MLNAPLRPLVLALCACFIAPLASASTFVYVSNSVDGDISSYRLDQLAGKLEPMAKVPAGVGVMSLAIAPTSDFMFASIRSVPFSVMSYRIAKDGVLQPISKSPLPASMAYLSVDKTGKQLLGASFGADLISVNRIDAKGQVSATPEQVIHTGKRAHAILVSPDNRFAFVSQLGTDQMLQYTFNAASGRLTPNLPAAINVETEAGAGPRHFVIAPKVLEGKRYVYVITEMAGTVDQFLLDEKKGTLEAVDTVSSVPKGEDMERGLARPVVGGDDALPPSIKPRIWQADLHLTPDGRFLFTSERTSSHLSLFSVDQQSGKLTYVESYTTEKQPRGFAIDSSGKFLVAAGQKSAHLSMYGIDSRTGKLTLLDRYEAGNGANWVSIVDR